jgi:hypothetical protein
VDAAILMIVLRRWFRCALVDLNLREKRVALDCPLLNVPLSSQAPHQQLRFTSIKRGIYEG